MENKQHSKKIISVIANIDRVVSDIKTIRIQGATNIARTAFSVLRQSILEMTFSDRDDFWSFLFLLVNKLVAARPTEPMLINGMKYALRQFKKNQNKDISTLVFEVDEALQELLDRIHDGDVLRSEKWVELFDDVQLVMTHCHSWSVVKLIRKAWEINNKFKMINTETRPLYQWRITAQDMLDIGVWTTLITDDMAPYFIDQTYGDTPKVDMVLLGCDAIKKDGSIVNKVGSFSIALSAHRSKVPVYIVASMLKYDAEDVVKIETRDWHELWKTAPKGIDILNFAFDTVPAEFITGFVTRYGIIKTENIPALIDKHYPWLKR